MNREIKFRVWYKEYSRFLCDDEYFISFENDKMLIGLLGSVGIDWKSCDGYEIIQNTGVVDKNGVDIYEGDILQIVGHPLVEEVAFIPSSYGVFLHTDSKRDDGVFESLGDYCSSDGYEVVGNIHENPELLEG